MSRLLYGNSFSKKYLPLTMILFLKGSSELDAFFYRNFEPFFFEGGKIQEKHECRLWYITCQGHCLFKHDMNKSFVVLWRGVQKHLLCSRSISKKRVFKLLGRNHRCCNNFSHSHCKKWSDWCLKCRFQGRSPL